MPTTITAVKCAQCHTLHPEHGAYLILTASVIEHKEEQQENGKPLSYEYKRREAQSVKVESIVVCNNECLCNFLSIKGF